jgi:hypothetical protein
VSLEFSSLHLSDQRFVFETGTLDALHMMKTMQSACQTRKNAVWGDFHGIKTDLLLKYTQV